MLFCLSSSVGSSFYSKNEGSRRMIPGSENWLMRASRWLSRLRHMTAHWKRVASV